MLPFSPPSLDDYLAAQDKLVGNRYVGYTTTDGRTFPSRHPYRAIVHQEGIDRMGGSRGASINAQSAQSSQYGQTQVQESTTTTTTTTKTDNSKQALADAQAAMMAEKREAVVNHFIEQAAENETTEAEVIRIRDNIYAGRADDLVKQQWDLIKSGKTAKAKVPAPALAQQAVQQYTQPQIGCQQQEYQGYQQMATPAQYKQQVRPSYQQGYSQITPPAQQNTIYGQQGYQGYQQVTLAAQQTMTNPQQAYQGYQQQVAGQTPAAGNITQQSTRSKGKEKLVSPPAQHNAQYRHYPQHEQQNDTAIQTYQQRAIPTSSHHTAAQNANPYGGYLMQQTITTTTSSSSPGAHQTQAQAANATNGQMEYGQQSIQQQLPAAFQQLHLTQGPHDPSTMALSNQRMQPAQQHFGAMEQQPQFANAGQQQHWPPAQIGHVASDQQQQMTNPQHHQMGPTLQYPYYAQSAQQQLPALASSLTAAATTSQAAKHSKTDKEKKDRKDKKERREKKSRK